MKILLSLRTCLLLASLGSVRADTVELTGTACLFGDKLALLVLYPAAPAAPVNFTLSEGQGQYGVKLVQVDTASRRVEIEQDGVKKFIAMCGTPDLAANPVGPEASLGAGVALDSQALASYLNGNDAVERIKAGNPVVNFAVATSKAGSNQNSDAAAGSCQSSTGATGSVDHSKETWYQESLTIEQSRIETAKDVLDGSMSPWPRTPLTPDNTPTQLIGREYYFVNHVAGAAMPGYVESLAAK